MHTLAGIDQFLVKLLVAAGATSPQARLLDVKPQAGDLYTCQPCAQRQKDAKKSKKRGQRGWRVCCVPPEFTVLTEVGHYGFDLVSTAGATSGARKQIGIHALVSTPAFSHANNGHVRKGMPPLPTCLQRGRSPQNQHSWCQALRWIGSTA